MRKTSTDKAAEGIARSIVAMLGERGWKPSSVREGKGEEYRVEYENVPTKRGRLQYVTVGVSPLGSSLGGVHVRCRFQLQDVDRSVLDGAGPGPSFNPYSGKWNFEFYYPENSEDHCLQRVREGLDRIGAP